MISKGYVEVMVGLLRDEPGKLQEFRRKLVNDKQSLVEAIMIIDRQLSDINSDEYLAKVAYREAMDG